MKKRIFLMFSLLLSCVMLFGGCGSTPPSPVGATTAKPFDFFIEYMNNATTSTNSIIASAVLKKLDSSDAQKVSFVSEYLSYNQKVEQDMMACIDCFNETSSAGSEKVGYYDVGGERIKVEYISARKIYSVEANDKLSYYRVLKADNIYTVENVNMGDDDFVSVKASIVYETSTSTLGIEWSMTDPSDRQALKVTKEVIKLRNGDVVLRCVIEDGSTNNKKYYTIESYLEIFTAKVKVAKSSENIGKIDKDRLTQKDYTKASTQDLMGYLIDIEYDKQEVTVNTFGDLAKWVQ